MNAKTLITALRKYKIKDAVIREVTLNDQHERGIYHRWQSEGKWGRSEDWYRANNQPFAETVPEGWSPVTAKFERRIDAVVIGKDMTAVEVKVSRADFFRDTEDKRRAWRDAADFFVYLVPKGLVTPSEVPDYCGLWYFDVDKYDPRSFWAHGITLEKRPKRNKDATGLPPYLVKSLLGRLSRHEMKLESLDTPPPPQ